MKSIVTNDARILNRCVKVHDLEMPTAECLEAHIRKQYATSSITTAMDDDFFKMASNKEQTFINAAFNQALLSPCQMRHGCVVVANGRILGKGYNHYRTKSSDKIINGCSCHAEMAAIRDCTRHYSTNKKQHYLLQLKVAKDQASAFQAHRLCC